MPSKKPAITVRVAPEKRDILDRLADEWGITLNELVSGFIDEGIDRCITLKPSDVRGDPLRCVSAIKAGDVLKGTEAASMLQGATIEKPGYMGDKLLAPLALAGGWLWVTSKTANGSQTHLSALLEVPTEMMERWKAMERWKQERLTSFREEVERYLTDQLAAHEKTSEPIEELPSTDLLDCPEEKPLSVEPLLKTTRLTRGEFCTRYELDPGSTYGTVVTMANAGGWVAPDGRVWTVEGKGAKAVWTAVEVPAIAPV